ncbi:hypothetical protein H1Q63_30140 [Desmonostoc muscorum CCALA 125]|nr:hypothetical protein [Desmonostoc muscorum CCALA 125]
MSRLETTISSGDGKNCDRSTFGHPHCILVINQYGSVKARDAINRRLYKGLTIVETAIYRVFLISEFSPKNLI